MAKQPGIYVEIMIQAPLDRLWQLTQQPELHERWDLRFSRIEYLPHPNASEPQRFLYETCIGFGLSIRGTGESAGQRALAGGETTSSLKFAAEDSKSLIREGSGYWRYVPTDAGIRFLTWYDYRVRFGVLGRALDLVFRPLIGWATAWSFDCLRLWAECEQAPECSIAFALMYAVARIAIAVIWIWHGLVPKLLFDNVDERTMLLHAGVPSAWLPLSLTLFGVGEILFGLAMLAAGSSRWLFVVNALLMLVALIAVAMQSPVYLQSAFNPVTLNLAIVALSVVGWLALPFTPMARHCKRKPPQEQA